MKIMESLNLGSRDGAEGTASRNTRMEQAILLRDGVDVVPYGDDEGDIRLPGFVLLNGF